MRRDCGTAESNKFDAADSSSGRVTKHNSYIHLISIQNMHKPKNSYEDQVHTNSKEINKIY